MSPAIADADYDKQGIEKRPQYLQRNLFKKNEEKFSGKLPLKMMQIKGMIQYEKVGGGSGRVKLLGNSALERDLGLLDSKVSLYSNL